MTKRPTATEKLEWHLQPRRSELPDDLRVEDPFTNGGRPGIGGAPSSQIPPRRVREAPIAYRSEGGIRVEYDGGAFWLKNHDAWLLFMDLRTAMKGVDVRGQDSG